MKSVIIVGAIWAAAASSTTAQQRIAVNLNTHSRVVIERSAGVIWPHILDLNTWKQGLKLTHYTGRVGQVGEVLAAVDPAKPRETTFFAENVELVPNRRRTIKLYEPGGRLLGYATWTLEEAKGRNVVGYDVYSQTVLPAQAGGMTRDALAERERQRYAINKQRFDAELLALKRLVEQR